ncbi:MAG: L-rhamnose/proton symporter RhaT [Armatimonadota bacterium]
MDNSTIMGFAFIFFAAINCGLFGLQYRIQRRYTVENTAFLSLLVATLILPPIACSILVPGWTTAIATAGAATTFAVAALGFGWGLGAVTYSYAFNVLGMALAAGIIKGISTAVGAIIPMMRQGDAIPTNAKVVTLIGIAILLIGTAVCAKAGVLREKETKAEAGPEPNTDYDQLDATASRRVATATRQAATSAPSRTMPKGAFLLGMTMCIVSGILSACANLGYDYAQPIEKAGMAMGRMELFSTLIRWMPMYWGGMLATTVVMGGQMLKSGTWRNYFAPGTGRDFGVAMGGGLVHFLAQIPYGIGAFYLGKLGTTVGWGMFLGMALVLASALGFLTGEWKGVSKRAGGNLYAGLAVLLFAMVVLAYANGLA